MCFIILDAITIGDTANHKLRALVHYSGGICFRPNTTEEGVQLFEREAFLSLAERVHPPLPTVAIDALTNVRHYPYSGLPSRRVPEHLTARAVGTQATLAPAAAGSSFGRIVREFKDLTQHPLTCWRVFMVEDNLRFWKILFTPGNGTVYFGGCWLLYIEFTQHYPHQPPILRFQTPIYHCNVNSDGKICHEILGAFTFLAAPLDR